MDESEFKELIQAGLGRAIVYALQNDVTVFREAILDACLKCCSVDPQSEGTRAGYMLELVKLTPENRFYCDKVLGALPRCADDWNAVQRFHFATYMAMDGDEEARLAIYDNFKPGPKHGEAIAIDFVRLDGLSGLVFGAAKIGELLLAIPNEVDEGWLWSAATDICGEKEALAALLQAGATDPRIEAYRLAAEAHTTNGDGKRDTSKQLAGISYAELKPRLPDLRAFELRLWAKRAGTNDLERAAFGLIEAEDLDDQIQHLRIFSGRPFPFDPMTLIELAVSKNEYLAYIAAVGLTQITNPAVRSAAFEFVEKRLVGRQMSISMLAQNFEANDHEVVLKWFETEADRDARHRMAMDLEAFWERHPEPALEAQMLLSVFNHGTCSFCRESIVRRLIELEALPPTIRNECAYDASDEVRELVVAK